MPTATELQINRLRTEIGFIMGDRAHGGPDRNEELEAYRKELAALMAQKQSVSQ